MTWEGEVKKASKSKAITVQPGVEFFINKKFVPMLLMEAIKQKFEPIVYVQGCFYCYSEAGFWQEVSEHKLGSFAAAELGRFAKAYSIRETISLLSYDVKTTCLGPQHLTQCH